MCMLKIMFARLNILLNFQLSRQSFFITNKLKVKHRIAYAIQGILLIYPIGVLWFVMTFHVFTKHHQFEWVLIDHSNILCFTNVIAAF